MKYWEDAMCILVVQQLLKSNNTFYLAIQCQFDYNSFWYNKHHPVNLIITVIILFPNGKLETK